MPGKEIVDDVQEEFVFICGRDKFKKKKICWFGGIIH